MKINVFLLLFSIALYSCQSNLDQKISAENSYDYLEKICDNIDEEKCKELKSSYKFINLIRFEDNGNVFIVITYDKPYKDLTFRDLLIKIEKSQEKKGEEKKDN